VGWPLTTEIASTVRNVRFAGRYRFVGLWKRPPRSARQQVSNRRESCMTLHGVTMQFLTIRHVTTYRYRRPVAFGEHRMMLHPRDSHDQRVIQADLKISPEPTNLCFVEDAFGNNVGIARFSRRSKELSFESVVCALSIRPVTPPSFSKTQYVPSPSTTASTSCRT
jgi:Bacterial transglutaminase-like N-terminal region